MFETEIYDKTVKVMQLEDWKTSIEDNFKPGDYFDEGIAWDLCTAAKLWQRLFSVRRASFFCKRKTDILNTFESKQRAGSMAVFRILPRRANSNARQGVNYDKVR